MKVLTPAQMREVDRLTMERGVTGPALMEKAGRGVVAEMMKRYTPLSAQRILIFCGKGNNGGDGFVIARHLQERFHPASLDIVLAGHASDISGDAAEMFRRAEAAGCPVHPELPPGAEHTTLIVDALLGTGLSGPARGRFAELIEKINTSFPKAKVVAVDTPSGLHPEGTAARADLTVTFTAPKPEQVLPPTCDHVGELVVVSIGSPASLLECSNLHLSEAADFSGLFAPRPRNAHKGLFGLVLVIGGDAGKGGAAAMAGLAALRIGAGLVTVATAEQERRTVTALAPELMTQSPEDGTSRMSVLGVGPGLGRRHEYQILARSLFLEATQPAVFDADGLNALADAWPGSPQSTRILTPHPGEMSRLTKLPVEAIQRDRVATAGAFAKDRSIILVLKGQRTMIALPDGRVWINPTGTPALAKGGSGDLLTGFIAGLLAQHPAQPDLATRAAVWLHGRAAELAEHRWTEFGVLATDLVQFLPEAIREIRNLSHAQ